MNLINDCWIPVRRKSGKKEKIAPWQLTDDSDSIQSLDTPRPDFDGGVMQFLIGLFQTICPPKNDEDWINWLDGDHPSPLKLKDILNKKKEYVDAFETCGEKGSFMQDFNPLSDKKNIKISQLLIDEPGENTLKKNIDHFIKRGRVNHICPSCTMMALFTLQVNAPSGGKGHRVSIRGGGPLTTLVISGPMQNQIKNVLWRDVWFNVLKEDHFLDNLNENNAPSDIFPWLAPTKTSDNKEIITVQDVSPLQVYWGMPRRIRIRWHEFRTGQCDLCGSSSKQLLKSYNTSINGINYSPQGWNHPLTPYCKKKNSPDFFSKKMSSDGLTYEHWFSFSLRSNNPPFRLAEVVRNCMRDEVQDSENRELRLYIFGYDMDKASACCWYESKFPLFHVRHDDQAFYNFVETLIEMAKDCADGLAKQVKNVWTVSSRKGDTSFFKNDFYHKTSEKFYELVKKAAKKQDRDINGAKRDFFLSYKNGFFYFV